MFYVCNYVPRYTNYYGNVINKNIYCKVNLELNKTLYGEHHVSSNAFMALSF